METSFPQFIHIVLKKCNIIIKDHLVSNNEKIDIENDHSLNKSERFFLKVNKESQNFFII